MSKRLTERVPAPFAGSKVNREAGTIEDVLICGFESANGNDYPADTFRRDFQVYEGRPVNCDHGKEATVDRRFGWFTNVTIDKEGKPRGRLNCLKSHPMYERVMEAAERNPALFGFSHVAHCDTTAGKNGRQVVNAIKRIESIDIVAEPATTKSLFECVRRTGVKTTLAKWLESLLPKLKAEDAKPLRKWIVLKEDDATMGPVMGAEIDGPPEGETGDLKTALMSALAPLLDEAFESGDVTKVVAALKDFVKLHAKHTGKGGGGADSETDSETDSAKESKKQPDRFAIVAELQKEFGPEYQPGLALMEALVLLPTPEARKALAAEARGKVKESQTPKSGGRCGRYKPISESKTSESAPAEDTKGFLARVME